MEEPIRLHYILNFAGVFQILTQFETSRLLGVGLVSVYFGGICAAISDSNWPHCCGPKYASCVSKLRQGLCRLQA